MSLLHTNLSEAFRSLWASRQRTLLALIGIVVGIGSVIGMVSIGTIVQNEAIRQFKDMGIDIISIRKKVDESKKSEFSMPAIKKITEEKRAILAVAPYLTGGMTEFRQGQQKINIEQMGVTATFFDLNKLHVLQGRAITELDENRYFCVVGQELADFLKMTGTSDIIGSSLMAEGHAFTIVGILDKTTEGGLRPYGLNRAMLVPLSTALRIFGNAEINTILARTAPDVPILEVKAEVADYFAKTAGGMQVEVTSADELIEKMKSQMRMFSLLLGAIGSIALIVGGIGVMNVMLMSVTERRSEIGLRRALGAQQRDILSQFLIESVILCLVGGCVGIVLGIVISYLFACLTKWEFIVSSFSIILGVGVSTIVGILCGFYPARAAARLDPIRALRS